MIESIGVRRGGGASREDKARKRDIDTRTMLGLPAELYWQPLGLEHGRIPAGCGQVEVNSWRVPRSCVELTSRHRARAYVIPNAYVSGRNFLNDCSLFPMKLQHRDCDKRVLRRKQRRSDVVGVIERAARDRGARINHRWSSRRERWAGGCAGDDRLTCRAAGTQESSRASHQAVLAQPQRTRSGDRGLELSDNLL